MAIDTVLLDLDGVIRHFDPDHPARVEQAHGLTPGALQAAAFDPELLGPVITGRMTRHDWIRRVGLVVGNDRAASEWLAARGRVDAEMMGIVDELRSNRIVVAVLTNGTDTIDEELRELGLTTRFDAVFNSAQIGFAKPDPRVFRYACAALEAEPGTVFFTDDSVAKLGGAIELGMVARPFEGVARFRQHLAELALTSGG